MGWKRYGATSPIDGTFKDGKDVPLHPHCRCDVLPVIDEDKDAVAKGFNPDQPRDEKGRFGSNGVASKKACDLKPEIAGLLGTTAKTLRLSATTEAKQQREHPEIKAGDYKRIGEMLDRGEIRTDRDNHFIVISKLSDQLHYAAIKITTTGKGAWIASFRMTRPSDVRRVVARSSLVRKEVE